MSILISISFINAISISPNPIVLSQQISSTKNYTIQIQNNFNFNIFDFNFTNLTQYGFINPNITILANETKNVTLVFSPTSSFFGIAKSIVKFKYFADIPTAVTTYNSNINSAPNGFSETFILLRQGDSIKWKNQDTISHTITSSLFTTTITPGSTYTHTFNQLGTFEITDPTWDEFPKFHQNVQVIERTSSEKVTNPDYNYEFNLNISFLLNPTTLEFELLEDNFEVPATGETEGLMRIKNIGNTTAEQITISSDSIWIDPKENNFNLNPNGQKFVAYKISPAIFNTDGTNKTYSINITIQSLNSELQSKQISVFVPFSQVFQDTESAEFVFSLLEKFCNANPNNLFCNPNRTIINGTGSNQSGNFSINVTDEDWVEFKTAVESVKTDTQRNTNDLKILADAFGLTTNDVLKLINQTYSKQLENEKKANTSQNIRWIIGFFIIIIVGIVTTVILVGIKRRKMSLTEGPYRFWRSLP